MRFHKGELAGMGAIALLPIAAVLGAFGPASTTTRAQLGPIAIEAQYPERLRSAMEERISIRLRNEGSRPVDEVTVSFDPEFMHAFSELGITPQPERAYDVVVEEMAPGETRLIEIDIHAGDYGRHEGHITVASSDGAAAALPVATLVFP